MIRIIKCLLTLTVATAATLAQANSWTYSKKKSEAGGTITDRNWTISVTHVANADTLTVSASSSPATSQDLEILDLTGDITTTDGFKLTLVGTNPAKWGGDSFAKKSKLTTVILPEGFTSIGDGSFAADTALTTVVIPSTLQTIGNNAFNGCTSLTTLVGLGSLEQITLGSSAFLKCEALKTVDLPAVSIINTTVFSGCTMMTNIIVTGGTLAKDAFKGCSSLEKVEFGKGVTDITGVLFSNCPKLKTIRFNGYPSGVLFSGDCKSNDAFAFLGQMSPDPRYALRIFVPDVQDWHDYFDNGVASVKKTWDDAPVAAKTAYAELYPGDPSPALFRNYERQSGYYRAEAWVFFEQPQVTGKVTLTIDSNVKVDITTPIGNPSPAFGSGNEYEVGSLPVCSIEKTASNSYGRFEAYGCEIAKLVEGSWTVVETNHSISGVQISGALANDEYRLTWLFNCAYQPQLSPVPVILGEALGTVATNSTPSLEGLYYPVGSSVTLEATDGAGKFVRWYGPGVTTENAYNNPITIPVRGDIPLTTADGPLKIKAFFRSPRFRYNGSTISDGYLAYSVTSLGGTDLELGSSVSHPPDMDFDFTKPIIHASSGAEYSIVRSSAKFFRLPFDGDDPEDSARRIRYPATLDRDGLLGDHSVGSLDNSYRFLDFGGDISYHSFTNSHIGTDGGGSWRTLVTIPNGTWGEILTNATVFKPWSELSDEGKQKWKNLGLGGRHPIGVTIGKWGGASLWIRYAAESPTLIIIR